MIADSNPVKKFNCPNCTNGNLIPFYSQKDVPVHSCILLSNRSEAIDFPKGQLELGYCQECGFISNMAFNSDLIDYTTQYEDQQGFSKTFSMFAEKLAKRLVERYELKNKSIIEIGCGKGDFLKLICNLGHNYGFGIDPAYIEGRIQTQNLQFIQEYYSDKHHYLKPDIIICRHTLEHIQSPYSFLTLLLGAIKSNPKTPVFIEVPDTYRILREGAFWDVYHEHCSYFTIESLTRLFRDRGFRILDIYLDYYDQYILMESRLNTQHNRNIEPNEPIEIHNFIQASKQRLEENTARWDETINILTLKKKRLAIWGSGSKCVTFLSQFVNPDLIIKVVDINPFRYGKFLPGSGIKIENPTILKTYEPDIVLIMNSVYRHEIGNELKKMSLSPQILQLDNPDHI